MDKYDILEAIGKRAGIKPDQGNEKSMDNLYELQSSFLQLIRINSSFFAINSSLLNITFEYPSNYRKNCSEKRTH